MKYKKVEIVIPSMSHIDDAKFSAINECIDKNCEVSFEFTGEMYTVSYDDILAQVKQIKKPK